MSVNAQAITDFLQAKAANHKDGRLIIQKGALNYVDKSKLSGWMRFKARLGFGNAAASNITKFINKNHDTLFRNKRDIKIFNKLIVNYNKKQTICWKKAVKIKSLAASSFSNKPKNSLKNHFNECKKTFKNLNPKKEKTVNEFLDAWAMLSFQLENLEIVDKAIDAKQFKIQEELLNEILNLKNEVRAACIDKGKNELKGSKTDQNKLLKKDQQNSLKSSLKDIRKNILTKYFAERLDKDKRKLVQMQLRFAEAQALPGFKKSCQPFLQGQLDRWQKKLDQGKPIAVPKWYHCTPQADILDKILNTDIMYMGKCYPGVFMANLPEVHTYGAFCIAMSDYVEYTGTHAKDAKGDFKDTFILPGYTGSTDKTQITFTDDIFGDDVVRQQQNAVMKDNQAGVSIWLGLQIGKETFNKFTKKGTAGVPIQGTKRIKATKPLRDYYADTTVAFVLYRDNHDQTNVNRIAKKYRFQAVAYENANALRDLVNSTYICTLPTAWQPMQHLGK